MSKKVFRKTRRCLALFVSLLLVVGAVSITPMSCLAREDDDAPSIAGGMNIYFVSPAGDDENDGISPETPWKSLAKASAVTLEAGENGSNHLLLEAGGVWNGEQLLIENAVGSEDFPVIIGRYGNGPDPVINGGGVNRGNKLNNVAVRIRNSAFIVIENLEITNSPNSSFPRSTSNQATLLSGLLVENNNAGDLRNVTIRNNTVHSVSSRMAGGGDKNQGGIIVQVRGTAVLSKFSNLQITGNEVYDVSHEGIYTSSDFWTRWMVEGIGNPNNPKGENWYGWDDVYIANNYVHHTAGDGVTIINTNNALVEYNLLDNTASDDYDWSGNPAHAALWMWDANNVHIRYNEVMNTGQAWTSNADGMAFDFDYGTQNCLYEYNYTHGNAGGLLMVCPDGWSTWSNNNWNGGASFNHVFRYNVSVNDRKQILRFVTSRSPGDTVHVYNNTFVWDQPLLPVADLNNNGQTYLIYNNIFYGPVCEYTWRTQNGVGVPSTTRYTWPTNTRTTYSNNLVWGGCEDRYILSTDPDRDNNAVFADPLFVNPYDTPPAGYFDFSARTVQIADVSGYMVQEESPAVAAGMDFVAAPDNDTILYFDSGLAQDTIEPPGWRSVSKNTISTQAGVLNTWRYGGSGTWGNYADHWNATNGAWAEFTFSSTRVQIQGNRGTDKMNETEFTVTLDGVTQTNDMPGVTLRSLNGSTSNNYWFAEITGLTDEVHTIRITLTKAAGSTRGLSITSGLYWNDETSVISPRRHPQKVPQWIERPETDYFGNPIVGKLTIGAHQINEAFAYITGPASVISGPGATAEYVVSVAYMPMISGIELQFEIDGAYLSGKSYEAVGFDFLGEGNYGTPIFWRVSGSKYIGTITLINADGVSGSVDIFKMAYDVLEDILGETEVTLNYIKLSYEGVDKYAEIKDAAVTTRFLKYYSKYDLNFDGVVDIHDLTYALQFFMAKEGDANWDEAKVADFCEDGLIDINDLLLILNNYTISYYN